VSYLIFLNSHIPPIPYFPSGINYDYLKKFSIYRAEQKAGNPDSSAAADRTGFSSMVFSSPAYSYVAGAMEAVPKAPDTGKCRLLGNWKEIITK
jgi:hypothetical protein